VSSHWNYRAIDGASFRFRHPPCNVDSRPHTSLPIATISSLDQVVMRYDYAEVHESEPPTHISTSGNG